jgi:sulfopyruvate decarboxylase subunit beta
MNRIECIEAFSRVRGGAPVIVSPGSAGHELAWAGHEDATIYNMEMGYAAPMCLGIALARPAQKVVALEGDGSMLMGLSTFATLARYPAPNLVIVVFDNQRYLTTGSGVVDSATAYGVDLAAMARGAGLRCVCSISKLDDFERAVGRAMSEDGPWVIVAHVDASDRGDPRARGGFPNDIVEQAVLFQQAVRQR